MESRLVTARDYSNNYAIKDFIKNDIASQYFDFNDIETLNIGIFGVLTDIQSSSAEDLSNIISTYAREIFPNLAEIPESIYSYAGAYNVTNLFANAASSNFILFVNENDIIKNGVRKGQYYEFLLDSNTQIKVDEYSFLLDYDIKITYRSYRGETVYSASYVKDFENHLSSINNPYIKIKRIEYNREKYLGLIINAHRVQVSEHTENLISNDKINLPKIVFNYENQICNFEVLYKAPTSDTYIQLEKRFYTTEPVRNPFCFFRFKDEGEIELSFTSRDSYFQPAFNGEIMIKIYTCNGKSDNFPLYTGDDIIVIPVGDKYTYNQNLALLALVQTACSGGTDMLSLDSIRDRYLDKMITVDSYTTENDLMIYFKAIQKKLGNEVTFIKKRDDCAMRLFTAFSLMKDTHGDIYHTNTLNIKTSIDELEEFPDYYSFKPGRVLTYDGNSRETCISRDDLDIYCRPTHNQEFFYTSPFIINIQKEQESVSYFYNSLNKNYTLDFSFANDESSVQFIGTSMKAYRNAIAGENEYRLRLSLAASVERYRDVVDQEGNVTDALRVKLILPSVKGEDKYSIDFNLVGYELDKHLYHFEAVIKTNDLLTVNNEIEIEDVLNIKSGNIENGVVPFDSPFKIAVFFNYDGEITGNRSKVHVKGMENYTVTNVYTNDPEERIEFITPIKCCRSSVAFDPKGPDDYWLRIIQVPMISTDVCDDMDNFQYLIDSIISQFIIIEGLLDKLTNNFSLDLKFYNTYGKSNYFIAGEEGNVLDRVNCSIKFKVTPVLGADEHKLVANVKTLIKTFIEGINDNGYNGIYISNCIRKLENELSDILHLKFISINDYDSMVQIIDNVGLDLKTVTREELRRYIPEFLTIGLEDINIQIMEK